VIDIHINLINCTKTLAVHSLQQAHVIRYPSGLYGHNEQLEGRTCNAPSYSSVIQGFYWPAYWTTP